MRLAPPQTRAYTYKVTVPPAEMPITLDELKAYLGITHSLSDTVLTLAISAVTHFAECYTNRYIIERTVETYRDFFPSRGNTEGYYPYGYIPSSYNSYSIGCDNIGYELRRSPAVSIVSLTYLDENQVSQTVDPSVYYLTKENDYSSVLTNPGSEWPKDALRRMDAVTIEFTAGLFPDAASVTDDWKQALLTHATALWANRGDCSNEACAKALPPSVMAFYQCQRISNL